MPSRQRTSASKQINTGKLLRDALPRFCAEASAAIAAKPADEMDGVPPSVLLAQFDTLVLTRWPADADRGGTFSVTVPGRLERRYSFSIPFDIPSGIVLADLDQSHQITAFEPIDAGVLQDLRSQLASTR